MTRADQFVQRVMDALPSGTPAREQIAAELRANIEDRVARGQSLDDVLQQLGDPVTLAESYLEAVPLISAPFGRRAAAKAIDALLIMAFILPVIGMLIWLGSDWIRPELIIIGIMCTGTLAGFYLVAAEAHYGYTVGKYLMGLRVVRESGARISIGQAIVRQLPMFFQVYWIDILFALFTDRRQRAFELLSKTRVVVERGPSGDLATS